MPTRASEQRHQMPPSHLPEESALSFARELRLRSERPAGHLKEEAFPEHVERFPLISRSNPVAEKHNPVGAKVLDRFQRMEPYKVMDQNNPFGLEHKLLGQQRHANLPPTPWRADQDSLSNGRIERSLSGTNYESGLFSSSLPDIFDTKLRVTSKSDHSGQPVQNLNRVDDETFELSDEIGAQIIGDLLPDDDDLLSGVLDDVGQPAHANNRDDVDDDIFYSGGGMELEADENNKSLELKIGANNVHNGLNGVLNGAKPYGTPSRILFVRNIDSNVDDSELKLLFEQYGDIRTLYTACKHRGFVIASYYDIRSAEYANQELQSKQLKRWKLDIHYYFPKDNPLERDIHNGTLVVSNLDPSVTNDDLRDMFRGYGEIKEIHDTSQIGQKSVEFYDIRAAETAQYALNRSEENQIKLGSGFLDGNRGLMQFRPLELEQEGFDAYKLGNPNSLPSSFYGSVNMASIRSTGPEYGISRGLRSTVQTPVNQFREGTFLDAPSTTTQSISSPVGIATAGTHNQFALGEHSHSLGRNGHINGHLNYGFQGSGSFHPHSLPEFHNARNNGISYNLSTIPPIGVKSNSRTTEGLDARHLYKGGSSNLGGHTEALGFSRTGSCPLHGQQLAWNNSNNSHHQHISPMLWTNSGPFMNNTPSRPLKQGHGMSRPSRMFENALPMNHHIGSAPAVNPSSWDRRHGHAGEMMEAPGFNPGSARSMGFPGSPHLHQLELNSMFAQTGGSRMEPAMSPVHIGGPSPQQRGHMVHGRSHMVPLPSSFDSPGERMRSRRNESSTANQSDNRKHYELDIERILRGDDSRTTLMIKNIPNKYTSKMLLAAIDESHRGTYDFIYLPIDFKNKCNVGYAFINMINPENIVPFYKVFHGKRWEKFNSEKVASLAYARIQGKSALIAHFQNSSLMNEDKRCRPILFHSDGPNAGDQEPFPTGTNIRSRSGRSRILSSGENYHDTLSTSANGGSQTSGHAKETDLTSA